MSSNSILLGLHGLDSYAREDTRSRATIKNPKDRREGEIWADCPPLYVQVRHLKSSVP